MIYCNVNDPVDVAAGQQGIYAWHGDRVISRVGMQPVDT